MTKQEMQEKFDMLYRYMASSNDVRYMRTFGNVHKQMMEWMIENKPEMAEEYIEELCAIKWEQYLTKKEATEVVHGMKPAAPWDYDKWAKAMTDLGLKMEVEGVYNKYALWVAMNQIYTDFGEDIAKLMGMPLKEIPANKIVPAVYSMAVSLLQDPDQRYKIREYHLGEK